MAPIRATTARRSRRLSSQVPVQYDEEGWETTDLLVHLTSPVSDGPSPTPSAISHASTQSDTPSPRRHAPLYRRTPEHVRRPLNAFMLFRSDYWRENKDAIRERDHREISRICGQLWRALPPDKKQVYGEMANVIKEAHLVKYPDYKFTPVSRKKKTRDTVSWKREASRHDGIESMGEDIEMTVLETNDVCITPSPPATDKGTSQFSQLFTSGYQRVFICGEEDTFVPTCDIPPLNLDAASNLEMYINPPQLPIYSRIDPQFGFKSTVDIDDCFWFTGMGESIGSSPSTDDFIQAFSDYGLCTNDGNSLDVLASFNFSTFSSFLDDRAYLTQ